MNSILRRTFVGAGSAMALRAAAGRKTTDTPAVLGGDPVREKGFPSWPRVEAADERNILAALRACKWWRAQGHYVRDFEQAWAKRMRARHCVATANGTSALIASLNALQVGPKDEVLVTPYTFIATINAILATYALPVFVDTDRETHLIDASKIEAGITRRTRAILPVHIGGNVADMDTIIAVARKHDLAIVEDACQAHLAEWKGQPVSTLGDLGCFSFQKYKNVPGGEAGGIVTNDDELYRHAYGYHSHYRNPPNEGSIGPDARNGVNLRLAEFQGSVLMAQMTRMEENARRRENNARALRRLLAEVPGVIPVKTYAHCTRNAHHMFMMRYDPDAFAGMPRARFIEAVRAEGIPLSSGYGPLNREPFLENTLGSRTFRAVYSEREITGWRERNNCPVNDQVCRESMWLSQPVMLGDEADMEDIALAMGKVHRHAEAIAKKRTEGENV